MARPHKPTSFGVDGPIGGNYYQGYVKMVASFRASASDAPRAVIAWKRTKAFIDESKAWDAAEQLGDGAPWTY